MARPPHPSSTHDVQNVGTHEVGHVVGSADLYRTNYSELTMYGYAGETRAFVIVFEPSLPLEAPGSQPLLHQPDPARSSPVQTLT